MQGPTIYACMYGTRARDAPARGAPSNAQQNTRPTHSPLLHTIRHNSTEGQVVTLGNLSATRCHSKVRCQAGHTQQHEKATCVATQVQRCGTRATVWPQQRRRRAPPSCRAPLILAAWQQIEMEHLEHTRCTITVDGMECERGEGGMVCALDTLHGPHASKRA
jgi:hypothetical protein